MSMDTEILLFLNGFVGQSHYFDNGVKMLENPILKALPFVLALVYFWFKEDDAQADRRRMVLTTIIVSMVAIAVGLLMATILPDRLRPLHDPDIQILMPQGHTDEILKGWSSMPSDHAVYFAAMCTFLVWMSRPIGLFFSVYAFLFVLLPRVYFGWHWPTDILVGALIGITVSLMLARPVLWMIKRAHLVGQMLRLPQFSYPALIFVAFQMATMFESLRDLLGDLVRAVI